MTAVMESLIKRIRWLRAAQTPASAVALSLVSRIAILIVNVATGIILAKTLGPASRGAVAAITLWLSVIGGTLTLGIPTALQYEIRRAAYGAPDLLSSGLILSAALGVLVSILGITLVPTLLAPYSTATIRCAQLIMLLAPLLASYRTLIAFFVSRGDFKRATALNYWPPLATLAGLVALWAIRKISPYSVAFMYELPFALLTVTTFVELRRFVQISKQLRAGMRALTSYGVRACGTEILATFAAQIDQAMVAGLFSAASFGIYTVALSAARVPSLIASSINTVLFPTASGLAEKPAITLICRSARLVFGCTFITTLTLVVALPLLVPLVYGKAYLGVIDIVRVLCVAIVLQTTAGTLIQAFLATGRPQIATVVQCISVVTTIPLMLSLIPRFGLNGAAFAIDIASTIRLASVMMAFPLILHQRIPGLMPTPGDIRDLLTRLRLSRPLT